MNYKMHLVIYNPNQEKGMCSDIGMCLDAQFYKNEKTYGNKYYVSITDGHNFDNHYDIRYDTSFDESRKEDWLRDWAESYWSGKDGAYAIKRLKIEWVGD